MIRLSSFRSGVRIPDVARSTLKQRLTNMPKPKIYHNRIDTLTTRKQWLAIKAYARQRNLKFGEAIRELVGQALGNERPS